MMAEENNAAAPGIHPHDAAGPRTTPLSRFAKRNSLDITITADRKKDKEAGSKKNSVDLTADKKKEKRGSNSSSGESTGEKKKRGSKVLQSMKMVFSPWKWGKTKKPAPSLLPTAVALERKLSVRPNRAKVIATGIVHEDGTRIPLLPLPPSLHQH